MLVNNEFTKKSDVFSLGVLMFWLITGHYPYDQITKEGFQRCLDYKVDNEEMINECPLKLKEVIIEMLNPDPDGRIEISDILNNEWFIEVEKLS